MADVLDLQNPDDSETPDEEKASTVSYSVCVNSNTSQFFCVRR